MRRGFGFGYDERMQPITLTTDRLVLRPLRAEDAPAVAEICQDAEIQKWTFVPSPYSLKDAEVFIKLTQGWWDSSQPTWIMVRQPASAEAGTAGEVAGTAGEVAGTAGGFGSAGAAGTPGAAVSPDQVAGVISYNNSLEPGGRGEIGFWANPAHRGQGYVSEALEAVIDYGFEFGLGAIGWRCEVHDGVPNMGSVRVAQKAGFVYDGYVRLEHANKGVLRDSLIATLTPEDPRVDNGPWDLPAGLNSQLSAD